MAEEKKSIANLIFKQQHQRNTGKIHLNSTMLSVLDEIDGKRSVHAVAKSLDMNLAELKTILAYLYKVKLIVLVDHGDEPILKESFFDSLLATLGNMVGPIGAIVLQDALQDMGETTTTFPIRRAQELIENIGSQIDFPDKQKEFLSLMQTELLKSK